jgi:hypothetical protein
MNWATEYVKLAGPGALHSLVHGGAGLTGGTLGGLSGAGVGSLVGLGVGALADPDHPITGAMAGAGLGAAGGGLFGAQRGKRLGQGIVRHVGMTGVPGI